MRVVGAVRARSPRESLRKRWPLWNAEASPDPDAQAIKDFNEHVLRDDRVELAMLAVGDGLTMARAR
jgi:predicted O-methyltransferase YrrM